MAGTRAQDPADGVFTIDRTSCSRSPEYAKISALIEDDPPEGGRRAQSSARGSGGAATAERSQESRSGGTAATRPRPGQPDPKEAITVRRSLGRVVVLFYTATCWRRARLSRASSRWPPQRRSKRRSRQSTKVIIELRFVSGSDSTNQSLSGGAEYWRRTRGRRGGPDPPQRSERSGFAPGDRSETGRRTLQHGAAFRSDARPRGLARHRRPSCLHSLGSMLTCETHRRRERAWHANWHDPELGSLVATSSPLPSAVPRRARSTPPSHQTRRQETARRAGNSYLPFIGRRPKSTHGTSELPRNRLTTRAPASYHTAHL
jgi:hypothetical protein